MAITDKNRKSTRYFNLEKRGSHHFDLEKEEVIPVISPKPTEIPKPTDVETKVQAASVTVTPPKGKQNPQPKPQSKPKNNKDGGKPGIQSAQQPVAPVVADTTKETGNEGSGSNKWMWIVGAILVVAIIAWFCVRGCSSSNDNGSTTAPTVEAVEASGTSEEEAVVEEPTTESEAEQPVSSDAETESSATAAEEVASADSPVSTATPSETTTSAHAATPASTPTTATNETVSKPATNASSSAGSTPAEEVSSDIEAEAMKVIRGVYGTGLERKLKLGSKYHEIQNRVNELKRQGAF